MLLFGLLDFLSLVPIQYIFPISYIPTFQFISLGKYEIISSIHEEIQHLDDLKSFLISVVVRFLKGYKVINYFVLLSLNNT